LHSKRKDLLNAIKPDLVLEPQPFILQYTGANSTKPIQIKAVYDSGYQFTQLDGFTEKQLPLRFIAYDDPFFYEVGDIAKTLTTTRSLNVYNIISNENGDWSAMGVTSAGNGVEAIRKYGDNLYVGGPFSNWNSDADMDGIVSYDLTNETWSALDIGTNNAVRDILIAANGDVYVCGDFTSAGGVANTGYIAMWDGSWNALGTGLSGGIANTLAMDSSGNLYVGGAFTAAGGVANTAYLAKWDGSSWSSIGVINSASVLSLVVDKEDNIYIGGSFTAIGGDSSISYIGKYDGSSWATLLSEPDSTVYCLVVDSKGNLYAGGSFTTIGGISATSIAEWNGSSWVALGSGLNASPLDLNIIDNLLYASGQFTIAGGLSVDRVAIWNGSSWSHLDVDFPGSPSVNEIIKIDNVIYYGFSTTGTANISYLQTITNNGTRSVYPKLVINRSGGTSATVQWMKNETTGATLYLNHSLLDGETLTIDFSEGKRTIKSSLSGSTWSSILRGSDLGNFYLLPGNNNISVFVNESGSPTITAYLQWRNTHWSADGVAT